MREKGPAIGSDRSGGVLSEPIESAAVKFGTKRPQVQILSPRPAETSFPSLRWITKKER